MRVLVTGATGFVGRHVVPRLVGAGHEVVALSRGERVADLPEDVERAPGDVTEPATLRAAAEGCDACVHLVAIIVERGGRTFDNTNVGGTQHVVEACRAARVSRLVHLSALGAHDGPFPYLRSKWQAERAVEASGLDWTILRPSALFGEGAGFFRPIVWTMRWMPFYPLPKGGATRFSPLAVDDLGECVVRALAGAGSAASIDLGGPNVLTFREMVEICMKALGKRRPLLTVPLWAARPFAFVQGLRKDPLVTNQQFDMVVLDNSCATDSVERAFGFEPVSLAGSDLRWLARL